MTQICQSSVQPQWEADIHVPDYMERVGLFYFFAFLLDTNFSGYFDILYFVFCLLSSTYKPVSQSCAVAKGIPYLPVQSLVFTLT